MFSLVHFGLSGEFGAFAAGRVEEEAGHVTVSASTVIQGMWDAVDWQCNRKSAILM